jgi:hypothetical protein
VSFRNSHSPHKQPEAAGAQNQKEPLGFPRGSKICRDRADYGVVVAVEVDVDVPVDVPIEVSAGGVDDEVSVIAEVSVDAAVSVEVADEPQAARPSMHTAAVAAIRDFNIRCS